MHDIACETAVTGGRICITPPRTPPRGALPLPTSIHTHATLRNSLSPRYLQLQPSDRANAFAWPREPAPFFVSGPLKVIPPTTSVACDLSADGSVSYRVSSPRLTTGLTTRVAFKPLDIFPSANFVRKVGDARFRGSLL